MSERSLYLKLSAFFFLYYGAVGVFIPYWALYLLDSGYSARDIGAAFAVLGAMRIATPFVWGRIMDRRGARMPIIVASMAACCALFALIPFAPGVATMLLLHAAYAVFWNAALPAFDVVTMHSIHGSRLDYSRIRLWGSIGFVVTVLLFGMLLEHLPLHIVPLSICALMLAMVALGLGIQDASPAAQDPALDSGLLRVMRKPAVLMLMTAAFLSQFSFAPFYSFFSVYLQQSGYGSSATGQFWALGVLAEVVVFVFAGALIRRFGLRAMLAFALLTTAARWVILALLVDSAWWLSLSQLLHLSSFGLYHTATVLCVHRLFPARLHGQGQALLAGLSFGLGGAFGNLLAGQYWEAAGGELIYLAAAAAGALGFVVVLLGLRAEELREDKADGRAGQASAEKRSKLSP